MQPTEDSFRALARSSPWRWRSLHFRHRGGPGGEVEAWIDRPGRMRILTTDDEERVVTEDVRPEMVWIHDIEPEYDADGLVACRPRKWGSPRSDIQFGDPMWQTYHWVAMLDPEELAEDTVVDEVRDDEVFGRPVWRARVRPLEGYEPCCGCCALLFSELSTRHEYENDWANHFAQTVFPDGHEIALDVETGIVVRIDPIGGSNPAPGGAIDILEVEAGP